MLRKDLLQNTVRDGRGDRLDEANRFEVVIVVDDRGTVQTLDDTRRAISDANQVQISVPFDQLREDVLVESLHVLLRGLVALQAVVLIVDGVDVVCHTLATTIAPGSHGHAGLVNVRKVELAGVENDQARHGDGLVGPLLRWGPSVSVSVVMLRSNLLCHRLGCSH